MGQAKATTRLLHEPGLEQLHQSAVALVAKLSLLLFMLDTLFLTLLLGFLVMGDYPEIHHHYIVFLVVAQIVKYLVLSTIAVQLVATWAARNIFITGHHLIVTKGVVSRSQIAYELQQLTQVEVKQGWIGQWLNFGTIHLTFMPVPGAPQELVLLDMAHPNDCATVLRKHLGEDKNDV